MFRKSPSSEIVDGYLGWASFPTTPISLAEQWHRDEWHKFTIPYWEKFFLDAVRQLRDGEEFRDRNSIDFAYWMQGTNYVEIVEAQCEHRMTLPEWRAMSLRSLAFLTRSSSPW